MNPSGTGKYRIIIFSRCITQLTNQGINITLDSQSEKVEERKPISTVKNQPVSQNLSFITQFLFL